MADGNITVTVNARADDVQALIAEVERLRAAMVALEAAAAEVDILAAYSRTDGRREWVSVGTWLRHGEVVAHMVDPRHNARANLPATRAQQEQR